MLARIAWVALVLVSRTVTPSALNPATASATFCGRLIAGRLILRAEPKSFRREDSETSCSCQLASLVLTDPD